MLLVPKEARSPRVTPPSVSVRKKKEKEKQIKSFSNAWTRKTSWGANFLHVSREVHMDTETLPVLWRELGLGELQGLPVLRS